MTDALKQALDEERNWRYAGFYPEVSDGRNTFVIFAEMIESRTGRIPRPATYGSES